jgi:hypothetical protein
MKCQLSPHCTPLLDIDCQSWQIVMYWFTNTSWTWLDVHCHVCNIMAIRSRVCLLFNQYFPFIHQALAFHCQCFFAISQPHNISFYTLSFAQLLNVPHFLNFYFANFVFLMLASIHCFVWREKYEWRMQDLSSYGKSLLTKWGGESLGSIHIKCFCSIKCNNSICHWPKCELVTKLFIFFKIIFFVIQLNFQWQKLLKIQYLPHLKSKISKSPSLNPTHQGFSNNTKSAPKLLYKFFYLNNFPIQQLFNYQ